MNYKRQESYLTHGNQYPTITAASVHRFRSTFLVKPELNEFINPLSQVNILNLFFSNATTIMQVLLMYILLTSTFKLL